MRGQVRVTAVPPVRELDVALLTSPETLQFLSLLLERLYYERPKEPIQHLSVDPGRIRLIVQLPDSWTDWLREMLEPLIQARLVLAA